MKIIITAVLSLALVGCMTPTAQRANTPAPPSSEPRPLTATATAHSVTLGGCTDTAAGVQFNFYKGTASGGESATALNASPLATCSYTDTAVTALQTYWYVAKAYLSTASPSLSGPSNEVSATIPADAQPPAPTGLTVETVTENRVPLKWTPVNLQGISYDVFRGVEPKLPDPKQLASGLTAASYVDTKPVKGQTRYYGVKSALGTKVSAMSATLAVTVP
jgi:hypothetical protein